MNIFLTGKIDCGKSTLINRFIEDFKGSLAGYKTIRAKTDLDDFFGVYLLDINDASTILDKTNKAGDCFEDKSLICYENVFNTRGTKLLGNYHKSDLVIMDEVGVMERNCAAFLDKVIEVLNSDTNVLGVIKQKDLSFLNAIRERRDVRIIEVNGLNNDEVLQELKNLFY